MAKTLLRGESASSPVLDFVRLWHELVHSSACGHDAGDPPSLINCRDLSESPFSSALLISAWERLVSKLRQQGVDTDTRFTAHQRRLLQRKLMDWTQTGQPEVPDRCSDTEFAHGVIEASVASNVGAHGGEGASSERDNAAGDHQCRVSAED